MNPTAFAPHYKGLQANPWQLDFLNSQGLFADRSKFTNAAHGGVHSAMTPDVGRDDGESMPPFGTEVQNRPSKLVFGAVVRSVVCWKWFSANSLSITKTRIRVQKSLT